MSERTGKMAAPRPLGGSRYHGGPFALPSLFLPKAASPSRNGEDSRTSRAGELLKNLLCFVEASTTSGSGWTRGKNGSLFDLVIHNFLISMIGRRWVKANFSPF